MFNLFGAIPDILMGRNPKDALFGNALAVSTALAAPQAIGSMFNGGGLLASGDQASMLAAQNAGLDGATEATNAALQSNQPVGLLSAEQAPAPVVNRSTQAGMFDTLNYKTGGLLGKADDAMNTANRIAKPIGTAMAVAKMIGGNDQPTQLQPPPQLPTAKMDLSGLLGYGQQQQQYDAQDADRRKQLMAMYASRIGGMG